MSDPLEDELVDWLRTRATPDSSAMADAMAAIDRLPDRRRRRSGWVLPAASIALGIIGLALLIPSIGGPSPLSSGSSPPDPRRDLQTPNRSDLVPPTPAASDGVALPDPSPFRDDPRALTCQDQAVAISAFEVAHARDMRLYLPAFSGWEPELLTDEPALVLIMGPDYPAHPYPGPSGVGPPPPSGPTDRHLCIVVGSEPPFATGYRYVSIVGFDADPVGVGQAGDLTGPCPEAWQKPMSLAWGHVDDLLAPRDVVPNRRDLIDGATALVRRTPAWGPGDDARRNLADALGALDDAERAYESADPVAEAQALDDAALLIEVALQAYQDLARGPSAPCYTDAGGGAGG